MGRRLSRVSRWERTSIPESGCSSRKTAIGLWPAIDGSMRIWTGGCSHVSGSTEATAAFDDVLFPFNSAGSNLSAVLPTDAQMKKTNNRKTTSIIGVMVSPSSELFRLGRGGILIGARSFRFPNQTCGKLTAKRILRMLCAAQCSMSVRIEPNLALRSERIRTSGNLPSEVSPP